MRFFGGSFGFGFDKPEWNILVQVIVFIATAAFDIIPYIPNPDGGKQVTQKTPQRPQGMAGLAVTVHIAVLFGKLGIINANDLPVVVLNIVHPDPKFFGFKAFIGPGLVNAFPLTELVPQSFLNGDILRLLTRIGQIDQQVFLSPGFAPRPNGIGGPEGIGAEITPGQRIFLRTVSKHQYLNPARIHLNADSISFDPKYPLPNIAAFLAVPGWPEPVAEIKEGTEIHILGKGRIVLIRFVPPGFGNDLPDQFIALKDIELSRGIVFSFLLGHNEWKLIAPADMGIVQHKYR